MNNFQRLHITSTRFNHQQAVNLVTAHARAIAIHGYSEANRGYQSESICVGGADQNQIDAFINSVNVNKSSFTDYTLNPINAPRQTNGDCSAPDLRGGRGPKMLFSSVGTLYMTSLQTFNHRSGTLPDRP
ncbi:MAG: hypothetical protein HC866_06790 [Leptolyngbyaceae cyanobacterium RU_5_1]|nr:hypothetical protein [Leptolyngbyaceae cyanobacterium RU_5_1]